MGDEKKSGHARVRTSDIPETVSAPASFAKPTDCARAPKVTKTVYVQHSATARAKGANMSEWISQRTSASSCNVRIWLIREDVVGYDASNAG